MVDRINLNLPSTYNTVRIQRKLHKTNLKVEKDGNGHENNKKDEKNQKNEKNENMALQPEPEKSDSIDIVV